MSNPFVESVLEMILVEEPDERGMRTVVSSSYAKIQGKSVFMHSTDDLCALVADTRVPWFSVRVTDPHHDQNARSLLGASIENWQFSEHLDFDDKVLLALNERFTPSELCEQLARSGPMPLNPEFIGGSVDQRHILLERLGLIVASSPEMIDAWTDLLFLEFKYRDKMFGKGLFDTFDSLEGGTTRYEQLKPDLDDHKRPTMLTLCAVQIMAAAFAPELVKTSMQRYTRSSLYDITRCELTGYINSDFSPIRKAFVHAMYLVNDFANEGFVQLHVTRAPIKAKDEVVVPALLSVMACSDKPAFSLSSMIGSPAALNQKILSTFIAHYLFRWRDDFSDKVMVEPRNAALKRALKKDFSIQHMFSQVTFRKAFSGKQRSLQAEMFGRLSTDVQALIRNRLWRELPRLLRGPNSDGLGGMVDFMLAIPGQSEPMRNLILPKLKKLLEKMNGNGFRHYNLCSALRKMLDKGVMDNRDIAKAITSLAVLDLVTDRLKIPRADLMPHITSRLGEQMIGVDLGL